MAGIVRQPIDLQSLERYISQNVPEIKTPIDLKQFGFGQSNPTYQLTGSDGTKFVLRKKPPGKLVSKTAHQVEREYKIIHALDKTDVPVPKTYCLCEDVSVIGTAFYIMQFLDGRIIEDATMPNVSPQDRTEMWHDAIRTLAKLHRVNPKDVGLETFGRPSGFYDRQIKTWTAITKAQAETVDVDTKEPVGQIPHLDEIFSFFKQKQFQPKDRGTPIHGDYKIDNLVFHKTEPRVIGILDWEMATIGHPLSDLINILNPYYLRDQPREQSLYDPTKFKDGATPGLPTSTQLIEWYTEVVGWDPTPELTWGIAFHYFRSAGIYQGIAARYAVRQASSAKAKEIAQLRHPMSELSWKHLQQAKALAIEKAKL